MRRAAGVLYESIAIQISVMIDPIERPLHIRPDRLGEFQIAATLVIRPGKANE